MILATARGYSHGEPNPHLGGTIKLSAHFLLNHIERQGNVQKVYIGARLKQDTILSNV